MGSRADGTSARALGKSPRALGINPRALKKDPRAHEKGLFVSVTQTAPRSEPEKTEQKETPCNLPVPPAPTPGAP